MPLKWFLYGFVNIAHTTSADFAKNSKIPIRLLTDFDGTPEL